MKNVPFICLAALILLGDLLLTLKFSGNLLNDIIGFGFAFVASVLAVVILRYFYNMWQKANFKYKNFISRVFEFVMVLLFLTTALFTVGNFSVYASSVMLSQKNLFFPFVSITAISLFLALGGKKILLKFAVLTFPAVLIIIAFIFAFSVQFMNVKYFVPYKAAETSLLSLFCPLILNLIVSVVAVSVLGKNKKNKICIVSVILAFGVVIVCAANVIGVFGSEFANTLTYPYPKAVSTASMGEIFSRLDGFFYAVSFFSTLIKTGTCVYLIKEISLCFIQKISAKNF